MKVGISVHDSLMVADPVRRRSLLSRIEQAGLDYVCVGDHVSFHDGTGFDGLTAATAALCEGRLPVLVGVYLLALRHPMLTARQLASISRPAPPWYGINVWCGLDADAAQARRLLASQLEGLYHLPFGKFERLTPAGHPAQVAEALAPYRAAGAAYITLVPAAASPEAGVEHAAAVRAMLDQVS